MQLNDQQHKYLIDLLDRQAEQLDRVAKMRHTTESETTEFMDEKKMVLEIRRLIGGSLSPNQMYRLLNEPGPSARAIAEWLKEDRAMLDRTFSGGDDAG